MGEGPHERVAPSGHPRSLFWDRERETRDRSARNARPFFHPFWQVYPAASPFSVRTFPVNFGLPFVFHCPCGLSLENPSFSALFSGSIISETALVVNSFQSLQVSRLPKTERRRERSFVSGLMVLCLSLCKKNVVTCSPQTSH